jgi:acyl-CoA thioesterase YciA
MSETTSQPIIRTVPRPSDINHNGHVFGGWILAQMDVAGGMLAMRRAQGPVATVAVEAMEFISPVLITDWISVYGYISATGRTSISVRMEVKAMRKGVSEEVLVTSGTFIYVHVDEHTRPKPLPPE